MRITSEELTCRELEHPGNPVGIFQYLYFQALLDALRFVLNPFRYGFLCRDGLRLKNSRLIQRIVY